MRRFAQFGTFYNLKNVKSKHEGVILLVKFQAQSVTLLKHHFCADIFPSFLDCRNLANQAPHLAKHYTQKFDIIVKVVEKLGRQQVSPI